MGRASESAAAVEVQRWLLPSQHGALPADAELQLELLAALALQPSQTLTTAVTTMTTISTMTQKLALLLVGPALQAVSLSITSIWTCMRAK